MIEKAGRRSNNQDSGFGFPHIPNYFRGAARALGLLTTDLTARDQGLLRHISWGLAPKGLKSGDPLLLAVLALFKPGTEGNKPIDEVAKSAGFYPKNLIIGDRKEDHHRYVFELKINDGLWWRSASIAVILPKPSAKLATRTHINQEKKNSERFAAGKKGIIPEIYFAQTTGLPILVREYITGQSLTDALKEGKDRNKIALALGELLAECFLAASVFPAEFEPEHIIISPVAGGYQARICNVYALYEGGDMVDMLVQMNKLLDGIGFMAEGSHFLQGFRGRVSEETFSQLITAAKSRYYLPRDSAPKTLPKLIETAAKLQG